MTDRETRIAKVPPLELRAAADEAGPKTIVGYAAPFGSRAEIYGFVEEYVPGCFTQSIGEDDIRCCWNHNSDFVLGRNKASTLTLKEDDFGLAIEATPPDTTWAKDHMVTIGRGDVSQMSIMFQAMDEEWAKEDGMYLRRITRAKLWEVSPVTFPAYDQTSVSARAIERYEAIKNSWTAAARVRRRALRLARLS